jgi:hypothetical protein
MTVHEHLAALPVRKAAIAVAKLRTSHRKQALEELAVALQGDTEILGRGIFATRPLLLEPGTRF